MTKRYEEIGKSIEAQGKLFVNLRHIPLVSASGVPVEEVKLTPTGTAYAAPAWVELALRMWENYKDCRSSHGQWRRTVMQEVLKRLEGMEPSARAETLAGVLACQSLVAGIEEECWRPIEQLSGLSRDEIERLFMGHYYGKAK